MPLLRRSDEEERQNLLGGAEMEMHRLRRIDHRALRRHRARFDEFLSWLLSKDTQLEMPGAGRTFRRRTAEFWEVWPIPSP